MKDVVQTVQNFIDEINIQIINRCNLKCNFCPRANIDESSLKEIESTGTMSTSMFIDIVDRCISAGIKHFCLTPRMGEVLIDTKLFDKLKYLEEHPAVSTYFFSTNLTYDARTLIEYLNSSRKCTIEVSYYGNKDRFIETTEGNEKFYQIFLENLARISASLQHKSKLTLVQRFEDEEVLPVVKMLISQGIVYNTKETRNFNIGGLLKNNVPTYDTITRNGECPTKLTGCILINGDYNLCYMNDVHNTMTQGNILKTDLKTLRKNAILDGHECCRLCDESW